MKSAKKHLILLVEDEYVVRTIAAAILADAGYEVVEASDGIAALAVLSARRPDLVVSDVRMPRCNGFELLQQIRADRDQADLPFVIVSAAGEASDHRMGMSLGADDYLTKPYEPAELLKSVAVRLARAAAVRERFREQQHFFEHIMPREVRSPLVSVLGYAELILNAAEAETGLTRDQLLEYGHGIRRAGWRLLETSKDFVLLTDLNDSASQSETTADDEPVVESVHGQAVEKHLRRYAAEFGRIDDLRIAIEDAAVCVPQSGLPRVWQHLVANALKYSLPGHSVTVRGRTVGENYEFSVVDAGRGLSPEQLRELFAPRPSHRQETNQPSPGMGLTLARRFAEISGGAFTLKPNAPGPGMTALLRLPVVVPAGRPGAASPAVAWTPDAPAALVGSTP